MGNQNRSWKSIYGSAALPITIVSLIVFILADEPVRSYASYVLLANGVLYTVLSAGWKGIFRFVLVNIVVLGLLFYVLFLNTRLSGVDLMQLLFASRLGLILYVIIVYALYFGIDILFPNAVGNFFRHFWMMVNIPGISRTLLYFFITYIFMAVLFGLVYSSIYFFLGSSSFAADRELQVLDFMYYSLFVLLTMGFSDIAPSHWLARITTLFQLLIGITAVVLYLGGVVGDISEHLKLMREHGS